jgi:hypothetical protein
MKRACVVKPHNAGLFSLINKVVTCLRIYESVHVDWSEGCIYGDCWTELFEPTAPPTGEFDTIVDYPFMDMTAANAGNLYENQGWGWRKNFHELWERLHVRSDIMADVDEMAEGTPFVSAIIRSDFHAAEQVNKRSQTLDEYAREFSQLNAERYFIMSSDEETLAWMNERFQCFWVALKKEGRMKTRGDTEIHTSVAQTPEDARWVLLEVMIAARATTLVHPVSNMATAALYINPDMKNVYLR